MTTITVLKAIDDSEKQAGVCWLDLDMEARTGHERWEPADFYERSDTMVRYRRFRTETFYGITFYDTQAQLDQVLGQS